MRRYKGKKSVAITMFDTVDSIVRSLIEFGAIVSTSGAEEGFWKVLKQAFISSNGTFESNLLEEYRDNRFFYALHLAYGSIGDMLNPVFVVHLDRVLNKATGLGYTNTYRLSSKSTLFDPVYQAQLDNVIGVSIVKYLWDRGRLFNILFTTSEELCQSSYQLQEVVTKYRLTPITIDIDVIPSLQEVRPGEITVRDIDMGGTLDLTLVRLLRTLCYKEQIPLTDVGWSHTETAHLSTITQGKLKGAHIGLPVTNYHTGDEEVYARTVYNNIRLVNAVLNFCNYNK